MIRHIHTSRATGVVALMLSLVTASVLAQAPDPSAAHSAHPAGDAPNASPGPLQMQQEIAKLREQMLRLEQQMQTSNGGKMAQGAAMRAARNQNGGSMSQASGMKMGGMRMMDDDMDMPMNGKKPDSSMSMPAGGRMGMGMMDDDMMRMGAMGGMNSPAAMATPSALPGFPGQSHVYHIGATDFFLDHSQHIVLTTQQQQTLAQQKQQSLLRQGELQRQIEAAEQELWQLTGADQPQIGSIEKKAREIERLRADMRIAFIRAVGESAKVLTDAQRQQLTGMAPAQPSTDQTNMPMPDKGHM